MCHLFRLIVDVLVVVVVVVVDLASVVVVVVFVVVSFRVWQNSSQGPAGNFNPI